MVGKQNGKKPGRSSTREQRRLIQLLVCLILFCGVFFGRGFLPRGMAVLRDTITADTDFAAAFAQLGASLEPGGSVRETLGRLWRGEEEAPSPSPAPVTPSPVPTPRPTLTPSPTPVPTPEPAQEPTPPPAADADLPDTPDRTTLAYADLGFTETMAPVEGECTSPYGWREYPMSEDGAEDFHYGVDLAAAEGTPVRAFADGVVDYIGESDAYGMYIQVRHSDAVTSFYAHCSELLRQPGEEVHMGDVVALSGSSGNVTGPHLHFEVRVDGLFRDPAWYLDFS